MGLKDWALGWTKAFGMDSVAKAAEPTQYSLQTVGVSGDFEFLAKGTSFRQDAIRRLGQGAHKFVLTPERGNKHDDLAVMVQGIKDSETLHVGYLPRGSEIQAAAHKLGLAMMAKGAILAIDGEVQEGDSGFTVLMSMPGADKLFEMLQEYS
jgi:hypothetical protein